MAAASIFPPPRIALHRSSALRRPPPKPYLTPTTQRQVSISALFSIRTVDLLARYRFDGGNSPDSDDPSFDRAVALFNGGDYHRCHDVLEELWNGAEEPIRTLLHGILQCAVGLHHLFNQNHRGAMMELGEGLCKLRKMDFDGGPFHRFEQEVSSMLEFLYQTQMELAACTDDFCLTMDGSDRSYQLLGSFAAGQQLYDVVVEPPDGAPYINFTPSRRYILDKPLRVKVPTLEATQEHLMACQ